MNPNNLDLVYPCPGQNPCPDGTRVCPFPVTGNEHGWVAEPKGDWFFSRNLWLVPNVDQSLSLDMNFLPIQSSLERSH